MSKLYLRSLLILSTFLLIHWGSAASISQRIFNGVNSTVASEYVIDITARFLDQLTTYGVGTLISPTVVLTDAQVVMGYNDFTLRFGSNDRGTSHSVEVAEAIWHPSYDLRTQIHDIGLIRLTRSRELNKIYKDFF